jgi:hypothetical protein
MRFTTLIMKRTIFLAVMCGSKIAINIFNECAACDCSLYLENGDSKFLQNICVLVVTYAAKHSSGLLSCLGRHGGEGVLS